MSSNNNKLNKKTAIYSLVAGALVGNAAEAAGILDKVDLSNFEDLAKNQGDFKAGNKNVMVYDKQGKNLGSLLKNEDIHLPNFSAVDSRLRILAAVQPQFGISVKHNTDNHFKNLHFGESNSFSTNVSMSSRHDHQGRNADFTVVRLTKMIPEVEVAEMSERADKEQFFDGTYEDHLRVGKGTYAVRQMREDGSSHTTVTKSAYTQDVAGKVIDFDKQLSKNFNGDHSIVTKRWNENKDHAMTTYGLPGDSGSPVFSYDKAKKKWVITAHAQQYFGLTDGRNTYAVVDPNFVNDIIKSYIGADIKNASGQYQWDYENSSTTSLNNSKTGKHIVSVQEEGTRHLDAEKANNGKDIYLSGNSHVDLKMQRTINMGAGGLYLNTDATISSEDENASLFASGIVVGEGKNVNLKVKNNNKDDNLIKLGKGKLTVNGKGGNNGNLVIGEGEVVLNQELAGAEAAYRFITLSSGRGTLTLEGDRQIHENNIRFGAKGGALNLNGKDMNWSRFSAADEHAKIQNKNTQDVSNVTLDGRFNYKGKSSGFKGMIGDVENSNQQKINLSLNGILNSVDVDANNKSELILTGGIGIDGNVNVASGDVYLGATPEFVSSNEKGQNVYGLSFKKYKANNFVVNNDSTLTFGRGQSTVGDLNVNNAIAHIGEEDNNTIRYLSDRGEGLKITTDKLRNGAFTEQEKRAAFTGEIRADKNSRIGIFNADVKATFNTSENSRVELNKGAFVELQGQGKEHQVANLHLNEGSVLSLNPENEFNAFNKLKVKKDLVANNGVVEFSTDIATSKGNKLIVEGIAQGNLKIDIKDSGKSLPKGVNINTLTPISLIELTNASQGKAAFSAEFLRDHVDVGAYRYKLNNNQIVVDKEYSKQLEAAEAERQRQAEIERQRVEAERKAEADKVLTNESFSNEPKDPKTLKLEQEESKQKEFIKQQLDEWKRAVEKAENLKKEQRARLGLDISSDDLPTSINEEGEKVDFDEPFALEDITSSVTALADAVVDSIDTVAALDVQNEATEISENLEAENVVEYKSLETNNVKPVSNSMFGVERSLQQKDLVSKYTNFGLTQSAQMAETLLANQGQVLKQAISSDINEGFKVTAGYQNQKRDFSYSDYRDFNQYGSTNSLFVEGQVGDDTRLGFGLQHSKFSSSHGDGFSSKSNLTQLNVFGKHQFKNNVFAAGELSLGVGKTEVSFGEYSQKMKQKTAGGSAVLGYDLKLTKDLSIKPFVGYGVQLNPEHSVNIDGAEIKSKKSISHGLKYGVQADYEIKIEDLKVKPFVKVSVAELKGKSKVSVNESSDFVMKKSKQVSAEVGLELKYKNFTMAASAETSKGNNFKKNTQAKLQFGLTF